MLTAEIDINPVEKGNTPCYCKSSDKIVKIIEKLEQIQALRFNFPTPDRNACQMFPSLICLMPFARRLHHCHGLRLSWMNCKIFLIIQNYVTYPCEHQLKHILGSREFVFNPKNILHKKRLKKMLQVHDIRFDYAHK